MLTLVSRTYRRLAGAVVAVTIVTVVLYATELWPLGAAHDGSYMADSTAPIVTELPEIEVVAEPIEW